MSPRPLLSAGLLGGVHRYAQHGDRYRLAHPCVLTSAPPARW